MWGGQVRTPEGHNTTVAQVRFPVVEHEFRSACARRRKDRARCTRTPIWFAWWRRFMVTVRVVVSIMPVKASVASLGNCATHLGRAFR